MGFGGSDRDEYLREFSVLSGVTSRFPGLTELVPSVYPDRKQTRPPRSMYDTDTKPVAEALLKAANRLKAPKGFGSFGATYLERLRQVQLLIDVPIAVTDPKAYEQDSPEAAALGEWANFLKEVDHLLADFRRRFPDIAIMRRRTPTDAESEIVARAKLSKLM
jgi:hypothetical protein